MKLESGAVPEHTIAAVAQSLGDRLPDLHRPLERAFLLQAAQDEAGVADSPRLTLPHFVYSLGLDQLGAEDPVAEAQRTSARFLVGNGTSFPASAEIPAEALDDPHPAPDITRGPLSEELAAAVGEAERNADTEGPFEVRYLRVPALQVNALWLHSLADEQDQFWVLGGGVVPTDAPRDALHFTALLRELATDWAQQFTESANTQGDPKLGG